MKIVLAKRHYGVHKPVKECEIPGQFSDYAKLQKGSKDDYAIDEAKVIAALPPKFLPVKPNLILLSVYDHAGGTGQRGLSLFRNWAKYFDAYCLNLILDEPKRKGDDE